MRFPRLSVALLARDRDGVAYLEFALGLPVFMTLILGGLETTNYMIAQLRTSQIAMSVADNAGRNPESIDEADVYEVFAGIPAIGGSMLDFQDNGKLVLSSIQDNGKTGTKAGQEIKWQRCYGDLDVAPRYGVEGDGAADDNLKNGLGASGHQIAAGKGTAVIFVEATYSYQPMFWDAIVGDKTIRYETAFNVRDRENNAITNVHGLDRLTC